MNINQKGFAPIIIALIVLVLAGVGGTSYYLINKQSPKQTACTMDAKICSDGSSVGRTGSNCEFAACPEVKVDETANWKTYRSNKRGFEIKYPNNWAMKDYEQSWGGASWDSPLDNQEKIFIDIVILPSASMGNFVNGCPTTSNADEVVGKVKFNGLEFCKVKIKDVGDVIPQKGFQIIRYSIINNDTGFAYQINLNVSGGRQTSEYYVPESEFKYELNTIEQMLSTFKFTNITAEQNNKLISAAVTGNLKEAKEAINAGADVNTRNTYEQTVLNLASMHGNHEVVQELINAGADVNLRDSAGWTALMYGANAGSSEVVQELINAGADVNVKSTDNKYTALGLSKKYVEVFNILKEAGSKD